MNLIVLPNNKSGGAEKAAFNQFKLFENFGKSEILYLFNDHSIPHEENVFSLNTSIKYKLLVILRLLLFLRKNNNKNILCHLSSVFYVLATLPSKNTTYNYFIHTDPKIELSTLKILYLKFFLLIGYDIRLFSLNKTYQNKINNYFNTSFLFSNYILFQYFKLDHNFNNILCVGRFDPVKNFHLLTDLVILFKEKIHLVSHEVVEHRNYFNKHIVNLQKSKNITLYQNIRTQKDLIPIANECKFFLIISKYEGLPTVLIEAASMGLIPLCISAPGVTEFIRSLNLKWLNTFETLEELTCFFFDLKKMNKDQLNLYRIEYFNAVNLYYGPETVKLNYEKIFKN